MNPLASFTALAGTWWTWVLHSTWQSSLVAVVAFAIVWLRRKRSASFLYAVLVVALLKFLVPPIISIPVFENPDASSAVAETAKARVVASVLEAYPPMMAEDLGPEPAAGSVPEPTATNTASQATATASQVAATPGPLSVENGTPTASVVTPPAQLAAPAVLPREAFDPLQHWKLLLALAHLSGIAVLGLVMANSYRHLRKLLHAAQPANDELSSLANEVAAQLHLRRPVAVLVSSTPCAPMATGLFKRRILLPEALTSLDPDEMRAVLAHELAHHRRMDLAFIWVEHLVTLLWWFNPLVWILVRAIHRTREDCCDDVVLSLGLAANNQYCRTLLHAAKRLHQPFTPRLVFGCVSKLHPMGQRLTRIMDTAVRRRAALTFGGIVGVFVMALVLLPTFLPVAADTDDTRTNTDVIAGTGQGPSGSVLRFDGVDDYILIPPNAQLDITGDVTVSAWIKTVPGARGTAFHRGNAKSEDYNYGLGVFDGKMAFIYLADLAHKGQTTTFAQAEGEIDEQWHYWTGVRDTTEKRVLLYKDGDLVGEAPLGEEVQYDTSKLGNGIGTAYSGPEGEPFRFFKGDIDQISLWNVARTPEAIRREIEQGIERNESGLVALWTFDADGQTIRDISSSKIAATLGSSLDPDANDPARVPADAAPAETPADSPSGPDGIVRGVVVNGATGEPIPGAFVAIDHSGDAGGANLGRLRNEGTYITAETDVKGRYTLEGVAIREGHPFYVTAPGFVRKEEVVSLTPQRPEHTQEVQLRPGATIVAKLEEGTGAPSADIVFRLTAKDGREFLPPRGDWPSWPYRMEPARDGAYEFPDLAPGQFQVEAIQYRPGSIAYLGAEEIEVAEGESKTLRIALRPRDTKVTIAVARDPYQAKEQPRTILTVGPELDLSMTPGYFVHPEDEHLGRILANAIVLHPAFGQNVMQELPADPASATALTYEITGLPEGTTYTAAVYTVGKYPNFGSLAVYPRWTAFEPKEHEAISVQIPWTEPKGPYVAGGSGVAAEAEDETGEHPVAVIGSPATVPATAEPGQEWHHTGIVMTRGVEFELAAEGSILWDPNLPSVGPTGAGRTPNGSCGRPEEFPMPDAPCGGLLGRIGRGQPFFIGERTKVTGDGGYLFLTVNDRMGEFGDNEGSFIVTATGAGSKASEASAQPAAAGPSGNVLRFDGVDDYVLIPPAEPLDLSETFTVSAWVRVEEGCSHEAPVLRRGDVRPGYDPYMFGIYRSRMHLGSFRGTSINHDTAETVTADYDDDWHYWTGVRDADAGRLYLYRDGELVDEAPTGGPLQYTTETMGNEMGAIDQGKWSGGSNWGFFKGAIDQISVWNVARKPEDIQREMKQGIKPDEAGLIALWTFDEDGQIIHDSSPSNISATLGSSPEPDANDPARVAAGVAPVQPVAVSAPDPAAKVGEEIAEHYANADAEVQEYIRWTASTFGRGDLWFAHDAFAQLTPQEREAKIAYHVQVLDGEYGRSLCRSLAEAGALKDKRLLPGLTKAAEYHRENANYDCRPKWMAVSALGRQDDISAVPTLVPLVDHGNQNTRMWARASLVRLTGQNFGDDKQAWGKWWNASGHEPMIDLSQLKPWVPLDQRMSTEPAAPPSTTVAPADVPPESQAVVDELPGELVFKGTYFHRSRGHDLSEPSVVWIKRSGEGEFIAASYLPAFNATTVAFVSKANEFSGYEGHYHGRDGRPPSKRFLDLANETVTVTHEGGEQNGQVETLTVPPGALFVPNSRPDSYTAHMGFFQLEIPTESDPDEVPCYDWDNAGKGMAGYTVRFENAGKEEVTVPAGRFNANHIVETQLSSGNTWFKKRAGHVTDYWVLDNGVVVRILRHREPYELQLLSVETPDELPGYLGKAPEKPAGTLTILSAVYGAKDRWVDLTDVLNQRIQNNTLEIRVSNALGGDPIYGVEKKLNVHYRVGDKTYVTSADELETLRLPEPRTAQSGTPTGGSNQSSQDAAAPPAKQSTLDRNRVKRPLAPVSKIGNTLVFNRDDIVEEMASYDTAEVVNTLNPQMAEDENGNVTGITSDNFEGLPLAKVIGLRNADVINSVNGIQLDSDQKLFEVTQKFGDASTFRLGITHNGKPMMITLKLEDSTGNPDRTQ